MDGRGNCFPRENTTPVRVPCNLQRRREMNPCRNPVVESDQENDNIFLPIILKQLKLEIF